MALQHWKDEEHWKEQWRYAWQLANAEGAAAKVCKDVQNCDSEKRIVWEVKLP